MPVLSPKDKLDFKDNAGNPAAGWKLFTYSAGTTTPLATYADKDGLAVNPNPIVLDSRGEATVYLAEDKVYDFEWKSPDGSQAYQRKGIANPNGMADLADPDKGAEMVGFKQAGAGAVERTTQDKLREIRSPQDHGVVFDGSPSDQARIDDFMGEAREEVSRTGQRVFIGEAAPFGGEWGGYSDYTGLSPLTRGLHNWGPRDAQVFADSSWGGLCVVGSSQASKAVNWPGHPTYKPSSIGVAGFGINDVAYGQAWGGYFDCVRTADAIGGFTVAIETALANLGPEVAPTPFDLTSGNAQSGVGWWGQSGAGLDLVAGDLAQIGLTPRDVNHASACAAFLSSYQQTGITAWATSTAYAVGDKREDTVSNTIWQCMVAHTSPGSGAMAADRAANSTRWKQVPAHLKGIVFGAGSLAEIGDGFNLFSAIDFTERMQVSWSRKTGAGAVEQSATIFADTIADGTPAVPLIFRAGQIFTTGKWSGQADGTYGAAIQGRGSGGSHTISFAWDGANLNFYVDNTLVKTL